MWSSVIWFAVPAVILLPMALHRWDSIKSGGIDLQITAFIWSGVTILHTRFSLHRRYKGDAALLFNPDMEHVIGSLGSG